MFRLLGEKIIIFKLKKIAYLDLCHQSGSNQAELFVHPIVCKSTADNKSPQAG